jgi:hypothetical protein
VLPGGGRRRRVGGTGHSRVEDTDRWNLRGLRMRALAATNLVVWCSGSAEKKRSGDTLGYVRALILDLFGPHREPLPCNFFILVFLKQFLQIEPEKTYSIL